MTTIQSLETKFANLPAAVGEQLSRSAENDVVVFDVSNEESRVYFFAQEKSDDIEIAVGDDFEIEVDGPVTLSIGIDGEHLITCLDRTGQIIPPGWHSITVYPKFGQPCFQGHPVPSEMGLDGDPGDDGVAA